MIPKEASLFLGQQVVEALQHAPPKGDFLEVREGEFQYVLREVQNEEAFLL